MLVVMGHTDFEYDFVNNHMYICCLRVKNIQIDFATYFKKSNTPDSPDIASIRDPTGSYLD